MSTTQVYTRARVQSLPMPQAGAPALIRLKIQAGAKLPFTTLAFQVRDPALLNGFAVGDSVAFRAERLHGDNVLVAIRKVEPCVKFRPCPPVGD